MTKKEEQQFQDRLARHLDELRWLYMELYGNDAMFTELCDNLHRFAQERSAALKKRDLERQADPEWYKSNDLTGMMLYIDNFAGDLNGVRRKLPYLEQTGVNMLHLMPFLDTVPERSDGGYAVADFRAVRPDLGTMEDLEKLAGACHKRGINLCMDFVMNHTSQDHEWAKKARQCDGEYMSRYFFFDSWNIPAEYEKTVPQVFPTTAPGNFTWLDDCRHFVMTSFYPYQWDLNYRNPRVFNEMMYNFLFLANRGMDMIRIDAVPYIWKDRLPQPAPGPHHCAHDADDRRDRLPLGDPAGRGGHGAGEGGALLWDGGKAGVPPALQCNHHVHHLAHGGHPACSGGSWISSTACPSSMCSSITCAVTTTSAGVWITSG